MTRAPRVLPSGPSSSLEPPNSLLRPLLWPDPGGRGSGTQGLVNHPQRGARSVSPYPVGQNCKGGWETCPGGRAATQPPPQGSGAPSFSDSQWHQCVPSVRGGIPTPSDPVLRSGSPDLCSQSGPMGTLRPCSVACAEWPKVGARWPAPQHHQNEWLTSKAASPASSIPALGQQMRAPPGSEGNSVTCRVTGRAFGWGGGDSMPSSQRLATVPLLCRTARTEEQPGPSHFRTEKLRIREG